MELTRCNPRFGRISRDNSVPRIFDDFLTPFFHHSTPSSPPVALAVNIFDREENIIIEAEVPGVEKDDIRIDVKGKLLTLGGERKESKVAENDQCYRKERKAGKFERSFNLPFEVQEEQVVASYKNGLLTLEISKPEEQQVRKIKIN